MAAAAAPAREPDAFVRVRTEWIAGDDASLSLQAESIVLLDACRLVANTPGSSESPIPIGRLVPGRPRTLVVQIAPVPGSDLVLICTGPRGRPIREAIAFPAVVRETPAPRHGAVEYPASPAGPR